MSILQRYVSKHVLAAMLIVLLGVISLDLIFRIIEEASKVSGNYTMANVIVYELIRLPSRIYQFMPMVGLIGCLTGLGALANSSELIVMRSSGISTLRLLCIALLPALILVVAAMLIGEYVAPKTEQMAEVYRAQVRGLERSVTKQGVWLRDGNDFVQINAVHSTDMIYGINIFVFENLELTDIIQAKQAIFVQDSWLLENVQITHVDNSAGNETITLEKRNSYRWHSQLDAPLLVSMAIEPDNLQIQQLWKFIQYYQQQSLNSVKYELAFWHKVFYPLILISLVIAGISFVLGPLRQVSMGYRIFWGVLAGITLKTLQDALGPITMVYGFSAMLAMLAPALLCAAIGLVMLARVR